MKKTSVYLPDYLKRQIALKAKLEKKSEAEVIREAITAAVIGTKRKPRAPLSDMGLGDPTIAERVDELMDDFGL